MTTTSIGRLFELLIEPPARTDSEMARILDLDVDVVRARLVDLKRRGIVAGPFEDGNSATWRSWFPTVAASIDALKRSGLSSARPILLPKLWWKAMWATHEVSPLGHH